MDNRSEEAKKHRTIIWVAEHGFQGWTCSQCEWNYPLPTLLNDAEAKSAYDRLALGKFREHACEGHAPRLGAVDSQSFTARIRKLVKQGFVKPEEMVVLVLTGHALKDADFTLKFHRGDLFTGTSHEAESAVLKPLQRSPLVLEPSVDAVVELLHAAEN